MSNVTKKGLMDQLNKVLINGIKLDTKLKNEIVNITLEELKIRRLYLKDMKKIDYFFGRVGEIGFHTKKGRYFNKDLGRVRIV
jgi:hypothetical protein